MVWWQFQESEVTDMSGLVPVSWKDSANALRENVLSIFERWLPGRRPVRRGRDDDWDFGFGALTLNGGPAIDLINDDDEIIIAAELPGLSEKDFQVELEGQRVVIRGEKKSAWEDKKDGYYYSESSYGSFYRAVPLPAEVNPDKAEAVYKHGVLRLRLPKTDAAKARRVKVKVN
ncbi:MAG TPA: Hsp20/alpha crystallin family protein [Candidatus Hydrogenedentes bacterium]|nr:Hsp20/alpha crystallin family protein [Candidatus Hydrogenedentota bacterium]